MPAASLQNAPIEVDFGLPHLAPQGPRPGCFGEFLDLDGEPGARRLARLVAQGDGYRVTAVGQDAMRQHRRIPAGQRVVPIGKGGLDVEPPQAVIGQRHGGVIDGDFDRRDAGSGEGPAADFQIAANRRLGRAADQMGAVQVQPEVGIAGGLRGVRLRSPARDDRDLGFVDLAVFAAYLQRDQVFSGGWFAGLRVKGEARLPGMGEAREQVADLGPFQPDVGVPDLFSVEQYGNGLCRRPADGPAPQRNLPGRRQRDLFAVILKAGVPHDGACSGQLGDFHLSRRHAHNPAARGRLDRDGLAAGTVPADIGDEREARKPRIRVIRMQLLDIGAHAAEFGLADARAVDEGFHGFDLDEADNPAVDPKDAGQHRQQPHRYGAASRRLRHGGRSAVQRIADSDGHLLGRDLDRATDCDRSPRRRFARSAAARSCRSAGSAGRRRE